MFLPSRDEKRNSNVPIVDKEGGYDSPTFVRAAHKSVYLNDVGIQPSKEVPLKSKPRFSKREKWMIAAIVLLAVLCLIFIILFVTTRSKSEDKQVENTCQTPTCLSIASDMLNAMNMSVDPCVDFFEYACGSWIANNIIPESKTSWSQFRVLYERNENVMRELIMNGNAKLAYADNEAIMKGFDMFDSCMDEDLIEARGAAPLHDLMRRYGSWNVTDANWTEASWNFMDSFVDIHKNLSIAPLFNMYVSVDLKDSTKNIIVLDQAGLGIPPESYHKNSTYNKKVRAAYKVLMVKLVKLLGGGEKTEELMMEVYDFEKTLAENFIPREQRRDANKIYKKISLRDFIKRSGIQSEIDLMQFLRKMFAETGYNITEDEMVVSYALDYFKNMTIVFRSTSKRVIANYMMWHVVLRFASQLSYDFREAFYDYQKSVRGSAGKDPRWQDCLGVVDGSFGMPFGLMFVDKTFTGQSKESAEDMIHDIRQVFLANLEELDWMDEETKKKARAKAIAVRENIGYPKYLKNNTALAHMFKGFEVNKTKFFENVLESYSFYNLKNYARLGKPVDKEKWSMTPPTVNAYYSPTDNKIAFPAGILQRPFYDHRFPRALNYGGIGMVVGHEITHGFDDNGRLFNKDGNLIEWWTNRSIAAFKKKTECLVHQYSNYTFHGKNLKGEQTLGENIADNGGIKQAFQAYQNWKKSPRGHEEPTLPGLKNFSNEQIFFLGFAQIWCSKYRNTSAIRQVDFGVHSPGKWRVIGSLSNFDEFAKAYNCPKGSPMNPETKCSVW